MPCAYAHIIGPLPAPTICRIWYGCFASSAASYTSGDELLFHLFMGLRDELICLSLSKFPLCKVENGMCFLDPVVAIARKEDHHPSIHRETGTLCLAWTRGNRCCAGPRQDAASQVPTRPHRQPPRTHLPGVGVGLAEANHHDQHRHRRRDPSSQLRSLFIRCRLVGLNVVRHLQLEMTGGTVTLIMSR